ncbi:CREB-regulated transcription coactivator 1-like [Pollicipes pollicipes]|uniref:CREB-regulated transcription coactivator 1-like n=1 Tax=Pollicipes pollicipes TaxID=41117 RepID=UPI0018851306|nr:CREB-regulated transcription coactivator 1-like [Pollicipes pollicipes]
MANPRKFSEKIALHAQKQAEETAAFEQIMREVGNTKTPKGSPVMPPSPSQPVFIHQSHLQPFHRGCGGSLPNVNQMAGYPPGHPHAVHQDMYRGPHVYAADQRSSGIGPHRSSRVTCEHRRDTSPYSPHAPHYLSPPADGSWRRTHSDSALHQSRQPGEAGAPGAAQPPPPRYSPVPQRRELAGVGVPDPGSSGGSSPAAPPGHWSPFDPKLSPLGVPAPGQRTGPAAEQRVPGIYNYNMYPDGADQRNGPPPPSINNSGSLPDLSSLNFPSPVQQPIDGDDSGTPPYCCSPGGMSPGGMSPSYPGPPSPNHLTVPLSSVSANYLHTCG